MVIGNSFNNFFNKFWFKIQNSGNDSGSGWGSYAIKNVIFHKCVNNLHIQKELRSKVNGYIGNPYKKSKNDILYWITKKSVVSYTKYLEIATIICNSNKYKWGISLEIKSFEVGLWWKYTSIVTINLILFLVVNQPIL